MTNIHEDIKDINIDDIIEVIVSLIENGDDFKSIIQGRNMITFLDNWKRENGSKIWENHKTQGKLCP